MRARAVVVWRVVATASLYGASALHAQATAARGVIVGAVSDTGLRSIPEAEVSIALSRVRVTANARGEFRITDLPAGHYLVLVRRIGFRSIAAGVAVEPGDTVRLALMLEPAVAELPAVEVRERGASVRLREFEERRKQGGGDFFDQAQIEARNATSVVDILRQAKSLRVVMQGAQQYAMSARQWTTCPMQIYVDGMPFAGTNPRLPPDLNLLPSPKETMAIEVYPGPESEPLWLSTGPQGAKRGCGAVLVWTRDGSSPSRP